MLKGLVCQILLRHKIYALKKIKNIVFKVFESQIHLGERTKNDEA